MIRDRMTAEDPRFKQKVNDKGAPVEDSDEDETYKETESRVLDLLMSELSDQQG